MLQLALEPGDYVVIGDNVKVRFSHMNDRNRNLAVLSFDAPREVGILRGAVYEEMLQTMASEGDEDALKALEKVREAQKRYEERRKENAQKRSLVKREKLQEKHRQRAMAAS